MSTRLKPFERIASDRLLSHLGEREFSMVLEGAYITTGKYNGSGLIETYVLDNSDIADHLRTAAQLAFEISLAQGIYTQGTAFSEICGSDVSRDNRNLLCVRLQIVELGTVQVGSPEMCFNT